MPQGSESFTKCIDVHFLLFVSVFKMPSAQENKDARRRARLLSQSFGSSAEEKWSCHGNLRPSSKISKTHLPRGSTRIARNVEREADRSKDLFVSSIIKQTFKKLPKNEQVSPTLSSLKRYLYIKNFNMFSVVSLYRNSIEPARPSPGITLDVTLPDLGITKDHNSAGNQDGDRWSGPH